MKPSTIFNKVGITLSIVVIPVGNFRIQIGQCGEGHVFEATGITVCDSTGSNKTLEVVGVITLPPTAEGLLRALQSVQSHIEKLSTESVEGGTKC